MFNSVLPSGALRPQEKGQGLVEYGLILVLVSIAAMAVMAALGVSITGVYEEIDHALSGQELNGTGTEYAVGGFSVSASGGPAVCTLSISPVPVTRYLDGEAVGAGENVTVSVTVNGSPATGGSGTTNGSGVAQVTIPNANSNCSGTITVTAGSNSRSVNY